MRLWDSSHPTLALPGKALYLGRVSVLPSRFSGICVWVSYGPSWIVHSAGNVSGWGGTSLVWSSRVFQTTHPGFVGESVSPQSQADSSFLGFRFLRFFQTMMIVKSSWVSSPHCSSGVRFVGWGQFESISTHIPAISMSSGRGSLKKSPIPFSKEN